MEHNETKVYNNPLILSHEWVKKGFCQSLASISKRDYGTDHGFSEKVMALDVDGYESSLPGANKCTMDAVIGIGTESKYTISNGRLLLVELRLNYKKAENSSIERMMAKERHTKDLLSGCFIDNKSYFIFDETIAPAKRREIDRKSRQYALVSQWEIVTPQEFNNEFAFLEDLPYKPKTDIGQLLSDAQRCIEANNIQGCFKLCSFLEKKYNHYYPRYEREECKAILKCWLSILSKLSEIVQEEEELRFEIEYRCEDVQKLLTNILK